MDYIIIGLLIVNLVLIVMCFISTLVISIYAPLENSNKLLSKDVVEPIYITPENNIDRQYTVDMLNRFYAMLKLIFYKENGLKTIEIDEVDNVGKNFMKIAWAKVNTGGNIL